MLNFILLLGQKCHTFIYLQSFDRFTEISQQLKDLLISGAITTVVHSCTVEARFNQHQNKQKPRFKQFIFQKFHFGIL